MTAPLNIREQLAKVQDHDIGARKLRLLERALDCYLSNLRAIETSMAVDKKYNVELAMVVSQVRDLRDQVVKCHAVHIIPDEE